MGFGQNKEQCLCGATTRDLRPKESSNGSSQSEVVTGVTIGGVPDSDANANTHQDDHRDPGIAIAIATTLLLPTRLDLAASNRNAKTNRAIANSDFHFNLSDAVCEVEKGVVLETNVCQTCMTVSTAKEWILYDKSGSHQVNSCIREPLVQWISLSLSM